MICTSIMVESLEQAEKMASIYPFVELRVDNVVLCRENLENLIKINNKLIITCRKSGLTKQERQTNLLRAVDAGVSYIDVGLEESHSLIMNLRKNMSSEQKLIISYHNNESLPPMDELLSLINICFDSGADIAKVACQCNSRTDAAKMLALYSGQAFQSRLISIGMGDKGKITRIAGVAMGAPFTYARADEGKETAPGQFAYSEMKEILDKLL